MTRQWQGGLPEGKRGAGEELRDGQGRLRVVGKVGAIAALSSGGGGARVAVAAQLRRRRC